MYSRVGARYALVGHSERRHLCGETNHVVRQKIEAALGAGLTPVVCVGETAAERKDGQATEVVEVQLRAAFEGLKFRYHSLGS
jgi:triosephosphate isomerase